MNFMLLAVALTMAFIYTEAPPAGWEAFMNHITKGEDNVGKHIECKEGGAPIGDLYYEVHGHQTIEITSFQVDRDNRKRGVGTALLTYFIEKIARQGGFSKITLKVDAVNKDAAVNIYKSVGFKSVGGDLMEKDL
ncbi:acetyltransferase (GNAT) family domain-containing protein [Ditylenchus destructor]|nr:acetyltransferase (GNAT) family domain-containing protein [Ditylenchus destructor]